MDFLLATLLYLAVIFSPGSYTTAEIEQYEQDNQAQVDAVSADPVLSQYVWTTHGPDVEHIVVVDPDEY